MLDADEEEVDAGKKDSGLPPIVDGGKKDSSPPIIDAGPPDTKLPPPPPPPPPVCQPGSAAGFPGGIYVPVVPGSKCTATQLTAFQNCLLDPATNAADCDKVTGPNGDDPCIQCIYTPDTAAAYGALIEVVGGARYNVIGCVEKVVGGTAGKTCAKALGDYVDCLHYVCDANCASSTAQEKEACYVSAESGVCSTYTTAYASCETTNPKIGTTCPKQGAESDIARQVRYAKLFCGK